MLKVFVERNLQLTCTNPGFNQRSVQFQIRNDGVTLCVDLSVSPYWSTPRDFYNFLRQIPKQKQAM